jgi:hypothetical protein
VSETGEVVLAQTGHKVTVIISHGFGIRGPLISYKHDGKFKRLSLMNLVYEAHVKKRKISPSDCFEPMDGDDFNVRADNLTKTSDRYRKTHKKRDTDPYSCWANGIDELYC